MALASSAWASKIDLSTVPPREGVEVIIYRDVDLTLVREQRTIRFHRGANEIAFSWADTHIDPTSVRIRIAGDGAGYALTETTYPPEQPNTLVWRITAPEDGPAPLEVSYFTSGLTWSASYTLILSHDESEGTLSADFSISNLSGETYEEARVALLTGGVRLIEQVVALGRPLEMAEKMMADGFAGRPAAMAPGMGGGMGGFAGEPTDGRLDAAARAGIGFEQEVSIAAGTVSEHERYNLDTELGLLDGWVTRLRFAESDKVKPEVLARKTLFAGGAPPVRVVKIRNDEEHGLGNSSLPEGPISVFRRDPAGRLIYVGDSIFPYAAVGQEVEFVAGPLPDVVVEERFMATRKRDIEFHEATQYLIAKVVERDYKVEVRNRDGVARKLELLQGRPGVANVVVGADDAEVEARLVRWKLPVEAGAEATLTYSIHEYHGTAVNKMPREGA